MGETLQTEEYCVPDAAYKFTLQDEWGDGICCSYGQGSFLVEYKGAAVTSGTEFGSEFTADFGECPTDDDDGTDDSFDDDDGTEDDCNPACTNKSPRTNKACEGIIKNLTKAQKKCVVPRWIEKKFCALECDKYGFGYQGE